MARLPRINRKTTIKDKSILKHAKDIVIALILAFGTLRVLLTSFGLYWDYVDPFYGGFMGGLIKAWNISVTHIAQQSGIFLPQLEGAEDGCAGFISFVFIFLIVVSVLIVKSRNIWLGIIYVLICLLPTILFGLSASVLSVAILAGGLMLFIINSQVKKISESWPGMAYAAVIVVAAFILMSVPFIAKAADRPAAIDNMRDGVGQKAAAAYYGENPLKDGKVMETKRGKAKGTAMIVHMSKPDSLYLRGFVGDTLGKDGWEAFSYGSYYKGRTLTYWLGQSGFNGLGQLGQARDLAKKGGKKLNESYSPAVNKISIETKDASSKYAYIPYEITADGVSDGDNWGNSFVTGGRHKLKDYSYEAGKNATGSWTGIAAKLFTNKVKASEQADYMRCESYYNADVYKKYTYISKEDREILSMNIGDSGDQRLGHVDYAKAIRNVKNEISMFSYTDKLHGYKKKKSPLENIFETREGYDVQFATAAVMMFRYYGIPARYVEGYLITKEDAEAGKQDITIPLSNAHAWVEIYVDGVGFVPVEVCPDYTGVMDEADYSVGIKTKSERTIPDQSKVNKKNPDKGTTDKGRGHAAKVPHRALIVIGIIAGILLLALLIILVIIVVRRIRVVSARNKIIKSGEPKEAVKLLYKRMEELNISPDKDTVDLGNKATYSELRIYEEDRKTMIDSFKKLKKNRKKKK